MLQALAVALALATPVPPPDASGWLESLYDAVAVDLRAGRPLVVQVHVPLCDNRVLRCGGHGLGDGDAPRHNLYWGTSGGFVGWFGRKGSGWRLLHVDAGDGDEVLERRVWRRRVVPGGAWRRRGVRQPFDVIVVALAWRGTAIDAALEAYVADLYGGAPRVVDGVRAGGAAHVVAYVGHNRWMDRDPYDFAAARRRGGAPARPKGTIAVACHTAAYLAGAVPGPARVPLLMTRDFLFAGAHSFEGAVGAFADAGSYAAIRRAAAGAYARGEGKEVRRVSGAFTNPADRRWAHER